MVAQEQGMSVASSGHTASLEAGLSGQWTDVEIINAVTSAIPADKRDQVLAMLLDRCARNDAEKVFESA